MSHVSSLVKCCSDCTWNSDQTISKKDHEIFWEYRCDRYKKVAAIGAIVLLTILAITLIVLLNQGVIKC